VKTVSEKVKLLEITLDQRTYIQETPKTNKSHACKSLSAINWSNLEVHEKVPVATEACISIQTIAVNLTIYQLISNIYIARSIYAL
jgi:hypothetical protein